MTTHLTSTPAPAPTINIQGAEGAIALFDKGGLQTRVAADLTHDHIAGVYVARVEAALRAKIADITRQYNEARAAHGKSINELQASLNKIGNGYLSEYAPLVKALSDLGFRDPEPELMSVAYSAPYDSIVVQTAITISAASGSRSPATLYRTWKASVTQEVSELRTRCDTHCALVEDLGKELASVRSALANLASVERQARAALVAKVVEGLDGGKELLSGIESSINVDDIIANLRTL